MVLLLHIIIALSSIGFTTYVYFSPSKPKLQASYALVAATLASGFYLVFANPAHMLQSCVSGLIYLGVVTVGIIATRSKLSETL